MSAPWDNLDHGANGGGHGRLLFKGERSLTCQMADTIRGNGTALYEYEYTHWAY